MLVVDICPFHEGITHSECKVAEYPMYIVIISSLIVCSALQIEVLLCFLGIFSVFYLP